MDTRKLPLKETKQPRGCRRLDYGGKAHLLDVMKILLKIWDGDIKYARNDTIQRCWRKAETPPPSWNADINNDVGSETLSTAKKQISKEDSDKICYLFNSIKIRADEDNGEVSKFAALSDSFAVDGGPMTQEDQMIIIVEWVNLEENAIVVDAEIDDEIERLESGTDAGNDEVNDDDDDNGMDLDDVLILKPKPKPTAKMTLLEAEGKITELREYLQAIDAPCKNMNMLLRIGQNIRAHNGAKRRQQKSMESYFDKN